MRSRSAEITSRRTGDRPVGEFLYLETRQMSLGRSVADRVDFSARLDRLDRCVLAPLELEDDLRAVRASTRIHALHAGQRRQRVLDRPGDRALDLAGVEPGYGRSMSRNGNWISGIDSSGRRNAAISPITVIDTNSMMTVTGRLRLNSAKVIPHPLNNPRRAQRDQSLLCMARGETGALPEPVAHRRRSSRAQHGGRLVVVRAKGARNVDAASRSRAAPRACAGHRLISSSSE